MRHHMVSLTLVYVSVAVLLGTAPAAAEEPGFEGLTAVPGRAAGGDVTVAPARPFVIGRDNLAFQNPSGAVTMSGMSGNCYTMAAVARLFHERARFDPAGKTGLGFEAVARALETPGGSFTVGGYQSLHQMSSATGMPDGRVDEWLEAATRHDLGLSAAAPPERAPANRADLVRLYELISTIHYLHYMQVQGHQFLENVLKGALAGEKAAGRVTVEAAAKAQAELGAGRLPLVLILHTKEVYGHVVLGYRLVRRGAASVDLFVYDSNTQFGAVRDESLLRVDLATGRFELRRQRAGATTSEHDSGYDGASWFSDPRNSCLVVLPDPNVRQDRAGELAQKVRRAAEETGYLLASGDFLRDATQRSPQESSLFKDVRSFIAGIEGVQRSQSIVPSWRGAELPPDASTEQVNQYLARNTDQAFRAIFPYALPPGVTITNTKIELDAADANRARVATTLTVEPGTPLERVAGAASSSAFFAGQAPLGRLIQELGEAFQGERLQVSVRMRLTKDRCPAAKLGPYAPVPVLESSHVVVGTLTGARPPGDHVVEVAAPLVDRALRAVAQSQGTLGKRFDFEYAVDVGAKTVKRTGWVQLDGLGAECRRGSFTLTGAAHGFAAVATADRGVTFATKRTAGTLQLVKAPGKSCFGASAAFAGDLDLHAGLGKLGDRLLFGAVGLLFEKAFRRFAGGVDRALQAGATRWVALAPGSTVRLVGVDVTSRRLAFRLEPVVLDLAGTARKLMGQDAVHVEVTDVRAQDDRLVVVLQNR